MNIILCVESTTDSVATCLEESDNFNFFFSLASLLLGVITILVGRYIYQKRKDAKYGFYINLLIYVKRIKPFFHEIGYQGITDYLCSKNSRENVLSTTLPPDRAEKILPLFTSLCREFIDFISHAENNIPPKGRISKLEKQGSLNEWYNNIITMVEFIQLCELLDQGITPYISDVQVELYIKKLNAFIKAIEFIEKKLSIAILS